MVAFFENIGNISIHNVGEEFSPFLSRHDSEKTCCSEEKGPQNRF